MTGRITLALIALALAPLCAAQSYPTRPVRMVVPFAAGGSTDIVGRTVAQKLTEALGATFIVDNRPGGSTMIGTELVAKAPPDGYTLLVVPAPFTINPSLQPKVPYDALADFTPITLINTTPLVLAVNPGVPARSVKELIALARAKPGVLNYGSSGIGGSNHLAGELFNAMARVSIMHVPYKGNAPALADLVGGHVDLVYNGLTSALPLIQAGKIRALAVTGLQRSSVLPDVPTLNESGLKGFEAIAWNGLAAPAKTPPEIIARLNAGVVRALAAPEVKERLRAEGSDPVGSKPEEFARFLRAEIAKWAKVIKLSGAKAQ
ncbi:MAG TPA: tripartite tricarboxylate transporter substrate binding protein [Burkholderiales bacterium]|nr:tripartite tricarboxylate transporter substrate binding protein [Burkholderiales bacterium]